MDDSNIDAELDRLYNEPTIRGEPHRLLVPMSREQKSLCTAFETCKQTAKRLGRPDDFYTLGCLYYYGKGTEKNEAEGIVNFKVAATLGHEGASVILAEFELALRRITLLINTGKLSLHHSKLSRLLSGS